MRQGGSHFIGSRIRPGRHPPPHPQPDGVATGLEQAGDIVGVVKNLLRVVGDRRREHIGADFLPIDVKLRVTGDIDSHKRTRRHGGEVERLPHPRRDVQVFVIVADPLPTPVRRLEDSHSPKSRGAPFRGLLLAVSVSRPRLHFPVANHARGERFSLVIDVDAAVGGHLAAVPEIALILGEDFRRRGHENLVSRLPNSSFRFPVSHFQFPTQPRLCGIDGQRVHTEFAAEVLHLSGLDRNERHQ